MLIVRLPPLHRDLTQASAPGEFENGGSFQDKGAHEAGVEGTRAPGTRIIGVQEITGAGPPEDEAEGQKTLQAFLGRVQIG